MYDRVFWEQSGHWEKFRENMFTLEVENKTLAVKPMNCPAHVQIFNQSLKSTATCRSASPSSAPATETNPQAPFTASCGCARSSRTMPISSAHRSKSPKSHPLSAICCRASMPISALPTSMSNSPTARPVRAGEDEVWDRAEAALRDATEGGGPRDDAQSRRRRLLWPEARIRAARCHRPRMAMRHAPGRLRSARAA